jgi:hypothetical protein
MSRSSGSLAWSFAIIALVLTPDARAKDASVVFHPAEETKFPAVTVDSDGVVHLTYVATRAGSTIADVFHSSSRDGRQWDEDVNVSNGAGASFDPAIVAGPRGEVIVAWAESFGGAPDIFAAISTDHGKTWAKPENVSHTPTHSTGPALGIAPDGSVHLVWSDIGVQGRSDIWHSELRDGEKTWSPPENISHTPGSSSATEIACGPNGRIAVTWGDATGGSESQSDIWFTLSTDGGKSWSPPRNLSNTPGVSANPSVAIDEEGRIHVAWDDAPLGDLSPDIFFLTSSDGKTFEPSQNISRTAGTSSNPEVATEAEKIALAWVDIGPKQKTPDIWFSWSADRGHTFKEAQNVTHSPGLCSSPDVVIAQGKAVLVWEEVEHFLSHIHTMVVPLK